MGVSIIIVGATGTGKTTEVKNRIKKVNPANILIYDVNAEYKDIYPYPFEDFKLYCLKAQQAYNKVIIFEEATIFLSNRTQNDQLKDILVRKRHTNNTIFLNFHSLRQVPRYIYDLSNYIILFKTNDSPELVTRKFEDDRLDAIFAEVKNSSNVHEKRELKIY